MFKKTAPVIFVIFAVLVTWAMTVFSQSPPKNSSSADCQNFRRVSGGESVISTFRWTSVTQADEYKLNLYGSAGNIVASLWYPAPITAIDLNITDFATGGAFQWEVEALLQSIPVCNTGRSEMRLRPGSGAVPVIVVTDAANPGQFITVPLSVNTPIPTPLPPFFIPTGTLDPNIPTSTPTPTNTFVP
jgi:hypothetical protein